MHSDDSPYVSGKVDFSVYKTYCNGENKGNFYKLGTTDSNGVVKFYYYYEYKYGNTKDEVWFSYVIDDKTVDGNSKHNGLITYHQASRAPEISDGVKLFNIYEDYYDNEPLVED